jgi:shikimate dehydrogenase
MICIPVTAGTQAKALRQLERCLPHADMVELRMDLICDGDLKFLIDRCRAHPAPVMILVTNRRKIPAGEKRIISHLYSGLGHVPFCAPPTEEEYEAISVERRRIAILKDAVVRGADFVDIEVDTAASLRNELLSLIKEYNSRTGMIVSHHDFQRTPPVKKLKEIFHACVLAGADIVKIVTFAKSPQDNLKVLDLIPYARRKDHEIIAFCMGEAGRMSRIVAPFLGSRISFAPLEHGAESAPGQLTVDEMRHAMDLIDGANPMHGLHTLPDAHPRDSLPMDEQNHVNSKAPSRTFALFGNPVAQSLSPLMHNAALKKMHINGIYVACCVKDLDAAVRGVRGMDMRGVSVTIPFKVAVMAYLDEVDADALKIGAVNTLVNDNGILKGYNTDWMGLVRSLEDVLDIKGKVFAVVGAGGTSRAAIFGILKKGGIPIVLNRNTKKGEQLAQEWGCAFHPLSEIGTVSADCLINTTPVGMMPDTEQSPVARDNLVNFRWVMDVIYHPFPTKLLKEAEAKGCIAISGLDMFIHQGVEQLRLWTGKEPPRSFMKRIIQEKLASSRNGR